jgi:hypothetical protein
MQRIFAQGEEASETARKVLSWILCARRPLSTFELLHALAVEIGDTEIDEDNFLDTEQLLTICAGLVTIDETSEHVRFIHYTTQEYLQRNRETWLPGAEVEIARICTAYLSLNDLSAGPCSSTQDYDRRVETLALLEYSAVHWGSHTNVLVEADFASEAGSEVRTEALAFLSNVRRCSCQEGVSFPKAQFSQREKDSQGATGSGVLDSHFCSNDGTLERRDGIDATPTAGLHYLGPLAKDIKKY